MSLRVLADIIQLCQKLAVLNFGRILLSRGFSTVVTHRYGRKMINATLAQLKMTVRNYGEVVFLINGRFKRLLSVLIVIVTDSQGHSYSLEQRCAGHEILMPRGIRPVSLKNPLRPVPWPTFLSVPPARPRSVCTPNRAHPCIHLLWLARPSRPFCDGPRVPRRTFIYH